MAKLVKPQMHCQISGTGIIAATIGVMVAIVSMSAQAASCSLPKSYYKHVSCTGDSRYFLAVKDSGAPVALLNKSGKKVVDLSRYQKVATDKISGGLIPVQRRGRVGYVNIKGREVVPAVYDVLSDGGGVSSWARPVSNGRIVVKKEDKFGAITTANKVVVPFSSNIKTMTNYQRGRTQVTHHSQRVQWLDKQGNIIKTASPDVPKPQADTQVSSPSSKASSVVAHTTKRSSVPPAPASFTTLYPDQQDGRWGFVDDKDVTMITYSFDEVMPFSEGLAGVRLGNKWGFVNLGGELVIPFRFDRSGIVKADSTQNLKPFTFYQGRAWIGNLKNGDKICINSQGDNVACAK